MRHLEYLRCRHVVCEAESMTAIADYPRSAPATPPNRDPILDVLRTALPASRLVLLAALAGGEGRGH